MSLTEVPVIDLAPARQGGLDERRRVARAIDVACREIGFFAITGHGDLKYAKTGLADVIASTG